MDNELDGCEIDYNDYLLGEDEDPLLFALFPEGASEEKVAEWKELFGE